MSTNTGIELTNQSGEPLLGKSGKNYKWSSDDLAQMIHLDNKYAEEGSGTIISSRLFIEKFGGVSSLAAGLNTDLKTGIDGSAVDMKDRI